VVIRVELSDFDAGDSVSMEYNSDVFGPPARRKRLSMSVTLTQQIEDTSGVTRAGYTAYRFKPIGQTRFGVRSLTVAEHDSSAIDDAIVDDASSGELMPLWMLIVVVGAGNLFAIDTGEGNTKITCVKLIDRRLLLSVCVGACDVRCATQSKRALCSHATSQCARCARIVATQQRHVSEFANFRSTNLQSSAEERRLCVERVRTAGSRRHIGR
jgi:hypothetical protein